MNKRNEHTATRPALLLVPVLALCLSAVACDSRNDDVVGDSADAANPAAGTGAAPQAQADRGLAEQGAMDPCAGLSGPELDECRLQEEGSAEVIGEVPDPGQPMDDQLGADDPMDPAEAPPPPVSEEPMENDPAENPDEVPPPA